jgi:small subunit ribosomal protein S1
MHVDTLSETVPASEMDFAALLDAYFAEDTLERGDIVSGTVLSVDNHGLIVGVGSDRDGFVSRRDIERLGMQPENFEVGHEVDVTVVRMEDDEGNLVLSVAQARQSEDWKIAEALLEQDDEWEGEVADANRGGLIMLFGNLRGFVPASHVVDLPRGLSEDDRLAYLQRYVGQKITVKVIEVNRKRRRLVFSQRDAERMNREARKETLLDELHEGEVRKGVVSGLRDFGAFVDLGGADGLVHISELAWHRVKHPRDLLNVGDEVEVYVLRLDSEGKRIGLSLKRLQPNPWDQVEDLYHIGQLVEGVVSRTAQFGAFISLDPGIEALLHASQISEPAPEDATLVIREGEALLMRVISIEADKQRLGLSLKEVTDEERTRWEMQQETEEFEDEPAVDDDTELDEVEEMPVEETVSS